MARRVTRTIKPATKAAQGFIDALKFVSIAQKDKGTVGETHCILWGKFVAASDGVLTAGHPIEEDLLACPQTAGLLHALERCSSQYAITQLPNVLALKSEKFRATVPCVDMGLLTIPTLDAPSVDVGETIREGFKTLNDLVTEKAERVLECSILLRDKTMIAGDGKILVEFWHGLSMPDAWLIVPKVAIAAIAKCELPIKQIGFSDHSITFYFTNGAWLRTQMYAEGWPDSVDRILNANSKQDTIPTMFFQALDVIEKFSEDGKVRLWADGNMVMSHDNSELGATYEINGLLYNSTFVYKSLKFIEPLAKTIDFKGPNGNLYFIGDKTRGTIAAMTGGAIT